MDLNYLFHRQQVEKSKAKSADSAAARQVHNEMAKRYQDEIQRASDGKVSFALDACGSSPVPAEAEDMTRADPTP